MIKVNDVVKTELGDGVVRSMVINNCQLYSIVGKRDDGGSLAMLLLKDADIQKYEKVGEHNEAI